MMPTSSRMAGSSGVRGRQVLGILTLSLALLAVASIATFTAAELFLAPSRPLSIPWWALVPAFVLSSHLSIDFEFRKDARSITFGQLPLALGAVFAGPYEVLGAAAAAVALDSLILRRQPFIKLAFNLAVGAVEAGTTVLAVAFFAGEAGPGVALWIGLLVGLLVGEFIGQLSMTLVLQIVGVPVTRASAITPLYAAGASTAVFTGVAIVAVTSVWTEPLAGFVILMLAGALALAYQAHRRVAAQQQSISDLYEFVRDLGPLDVRGTRVLEVLENVRVLLHTTTLDLALAVDNDEWTHLTVTEDAASNSAELDALANLTIATGGARLLGRGAGDAGRMSTPMFGSKGVLGILSALERSGDVRDFDMGDLRLLETIATQLATAIERGNLLVDLERSATTDSLTGLPNLAECSRRIDQMLDAGGGVLVAAIAVDSFREVNDTLGHQVGDELLLEVTRRLALAVPGALVGRIGGGRFAVAVPGDQYSGDPELLGLGLRALVEGGAQLGPIGTHVRLSVGCAKGPEHGSDAEHLVRRAETAMYSARHAHGGPVLWEPAYEVKGQRRLAVVTALREALASGAIGVAFQPKVNTSSGEVTGVEALARWTHPALGAITPDEFIPLAEASGLMGPLTTTVLRQSLTACKGWQRRAGKVGVAVNVTADTVLDPAFVTEVAALLTTTGVPAELVTLELTEGVVLDDPARAVERMNELRQLGVKLSVDDFGTGYSSLTYLKGLPVDEVKIDKGFVHNLVDDPADRAVVRAVVDIAHTLGMRVIAEGVEQEDQQQILRTLGVDELQGYLFARPMAALDMATWLRRRETVRR